MASKIMEEYKRMSENGNGKRKSVNAYFVFYILHKNTRRNFLVSAHTAPKCELKLIRHAADQYSEFHVSANRCLSL